VFSWGRIILLFVQNSPIELNVRSSACLELNVGSTVVNVRNKWVWHVIQQGELT
jgi:hypothetical protein